MRRSHYRASAMLLAFTLAATLLAGCGLPWPFPQPTPDPKLPDALQIFRPLSVGYGVGGDVEALDPAMIVDQTDYNEAQLIFPGLVTLDEKGALVNWASESHEVSGDGLTYTFHLRKGMTWSDGTPIDANTFAYSINRALDPCTGALTPTYLSIIKGVQAFIQGRCPLGAIKSATTLVGSSLLTPDPFTLKIILQQPAGYFLSVLTLPLAWAVPQALVERYTQPEAEPRGDSPVDTSTWTEHLTDNGGFGGNLYRLTKWDHRGRLELERNERFWGRKPLLRRIEFSLYESAGAAWENFKTETGDVSPVPLSDANGPNSAELALAHTLAGVNVLQTDSLYPIFLSIGSQNAPFDDLRVRQAFALAIDRQAIAHEVYQDTVQPSSHLLPEGMAGYNPDLADTAGRTGKDALTPDLDTARRLASAYAAEKCNGDYAQCPAITYFVRGAELQGHGARGKLYYLLLDQWRKAFPGWKFLFDDGCHVQICERKPAQIATSGWLAEYPDPQDFFSNLWITNAFYNFSFISNPEVDALCAQADALQNQAMRISLYQQAEQLLVAQVAAIPLNQAMDVQAVRSHVVGWRGAPSGVTPLLVWQQVYIRR